MPLYLFSTIHRASRQISAHLENDMSDLGLNLGEAYLLSYIENNDRCPIPELHRVLGQKRSTLASMLDRLHVRRLILRDVNPEDRRSLIVRLTRSGHIAAKRVQKMLESLQSDVVGHVDNEDLDGFNAVMSAITSVAEGEGDAKGKSE